MNLKLGVPCSKIKDRIKSDDINCSSEVQAMGIAAGMYLGGKKVSVYMQNSGLFTIGDIVLSLYKPYEIPLPKLLLSIRHKPHHHFYAGNKTYEFLELLEYTDNVEIVEQSGD